MQKTCAKRGENSRDVTVFELFENEPNRGEKEVLQLHTKGRHIRKSLSAIEVHGFLKWEKLYGTLILMALFKKFFVNHIFQIDKCSFNAIHF